MPHDTQADFEQIASAVALGFNRFSESVVAEIRDRLNVPVEYAPGENGKTIVIRSVQGEPPRRETGALRESIAGEVTSDENKVTLEVGSDVRYAPFLDPNKRRLIFTDIVEEFEDQAVQSLIEALSQIKG